MKPAKAPTEIIDRLIAFFLYGFLIGVVLASFVWGLFFYR